MPADLKDPFGPSCCDGGSGSDSHQSAQHCGCDMGCKPKPWYCRQHAWLEQVREEIREELERQLKIKNGA